MAYFFEPSYFGGSTLFDGHMNFDPFSRGSGFYGHGCPRQQHMRPFFGNGYDSDSSEDEVQFVPTRRQYQHPRAKSPKQPARKVVPIQNGHQQRSPSPVAAPITLNKVELEKGNNAAAVIQKAYRKYRLAKETRAALVIQKCLKDTLACKKAQTIIPTLQRLQTIRNDFDELVKFSLSFKSVLSHDLVFEEGTTNLKYRGPNRAFLEYEDQLTKLMLKADQIQSEGDETVRNHRKHLISRIQGLLDDVDKFKVEQMDLQSQRLEEEYSSSDYGSSFEEMFLDQ